MRTPAASARFPRWLVAGVAALVLVGVAIAAFYLRSPLPPPIVRSTQLTSDGFYKAGLVTDGSRLYFTEFAGDHYIVSHVSVAGGETATIPTRFRIPTCVYDLLIEGVYTRNR